MSERFDELLVRVRQRDRFALSRLLTRISRDEQTAAVRAALAGEMRTARVVAVTGSAGVGKSTLIGRLIELLRSRGTSVAVLACDPESPLTGGALLGDRIRMPSRPDDAGLFIRSLTATGGHEAVAGHLDLMLCALDAFGFDVVLIETAGAGQSDTAVRDLADAVVLLVQPESGDDLQWQKAGLLEVADVVVVHKADLPGAESAENRIREILNLPGCRTVPVLRASAGKGTGVEELWDAIEAIPSPEPDGVRSGQRGDQAGRALLRLAQQQIARRYDSEPSRVDPLLDRWRRQEIDDQQAVDEFLRLLDT